VKTQRLPTFLTGIIHSQSKKRIMLLSQLKRLNRDKREGEQERQ